MKHIKKSALWIILISSVLLSFKAVDDYFEVSKNLDIFSTAYREVNTNYVDEVKPGELIRAAMDGMLKSLDPYTVYYSEAQAEDYRFQVTGTYAGIGATIRKIGEDIVIDAPYEGFPAQKAGLRAGDVILSVDDESMIGKSTSEVTTFLKGKAGTSVILNVRRPGKGDLSVAVEREMIKRKNVPYQAKLDNEVGYIKLVGFTPGAASEVRSALLELKKQGANSIILDLRGNGGGLLHEAVAIVNLFVPKGKTVVITKGKHSEEDRIYKTLNNPIDTETPMVVFIDERSASASEIVSGALQDLDRAVVVGNRSFGKGLVQRPKKLTYGTQLKVTISRYYTPSGRCIQALDYWNRDEEGNAVRTKQENITEFKTKNGRSVFDGGGVQPDVELLNLKQTNVTKNILKDDLIFNYATNYFYNNSVADYNGFKLSDVDFNNFKSYLKSNNFSYKTKTEGALEKAMKIASEEELLGNLSNSYSNLTNELNAIKNKAIDSNKDQILMLLENEIVKRYFYREGMYEYVLKNNDVVNKAKEILSEKQKYLSYLK